MKDTAYIVNCARGGIIDEEALYDALVNNKIGGAALDVYEEEPPAEDSKLFELDNIVLTPHIAASTQEAQRDGYDPQDPRSRGRVRSGAWTHA